MTRWLLSCALLAGLAGCHDPEVEQLTKVKTAVCACKDSKCAELALADVPKNDVKATRRSQAVARDMLECLAKLYDAERPKTDPDAQDDGSAAAAPAPAPAAAAAAPVTLPKPAAGSAR